MPNPQQVDLFGDPVSMPFDWKEEWEGMPEFVQEDHTSFRKLTIHFKCQADVEAFAALLNQRITPKQKSLWYPRMEPRRYGDKRYVDEP